MLVVEPVQAAIWHCLNHYAFSDATFLAEKLLAESESEEAVFLVATCYFRPELLSSLLIQYIFLDIVSCILG